MSISLIVTSLSESYIYEGDLKKGWTWKLDNDNFNPGQKSQVWLRNILIQLRLSQILYKDCTLTIFPWKISICHPVHIEIGVHQVTIRFMSGSNKVKSGQSTQFHHKLFRKTQATVGTSYKWLRNACHCKSVYLRCHMTHVWMVNFNDLNMSTPLAAFQ